eukprot:jgi/Botrbrau1/14291/Bobra.0369s0005.1
MYVCHALIHDSSCMRAEVAVHAVRCSLKHRGLVTLVLPRGSTIQPLRRKCSVYDRSLIRCSHVDTETTLSRGAKDFENFLVELQLDIIKRATEIDESGKQFQLDTFHRNPSTPSTGFGVTAVLEDGNLLEKAAVNISVISGVLSAERAKAMTERGRGIDPTGGQPYNALALSLVFHPQHPLIPTLRADVRMFQVGDSTWYGGGADLTPVYLFPEDARQFHSFWKQVCDKHSPQLYPEYKAWCDRYFYLPARREHRGIGGIFFDDLEDSPENGFDAQQFVMDVGRGILKSWEDIVKTRREEPYGRTERDWQLLRRGRYLEFNLLYDRGVRFGLDGGRMESIMVSAPPLIAWRYNVVPHPGSREAALLEVLAHPRDWVDPA